LIVVVTLAAHLPAWRAIGRDETTRESHAAIASRNASQPTRKHRVTTDHDDD
jgi:hypothetical protein